MGNQAGQAVSAARIKPSPRPRMFYPAAAVAAAAIVFVGFAQTYYLKGMFGTPPLTALLHVHGAVMTSWILLLVTQATLVSVRRTDIHRKLGVAGGVLAIAVVVIGVATAIQSVRRGHAPVGGSPFAFLVVPLGDMLLFSSFVAAAFYFRRRPELHKRLIVLATLSILPAGIARWPLSFLSHQPLRFFLVADLLLLACVAYDYAKTRRLNPAYMWGGPLLIASHPLRFMVANTGAWTAFAHWITGV